MCICPSLLYLIRAARCCSQAPNLLLLDCRSFPSVFILQQGVPGGFILVVGSTTPPSRLCALFQGRAQSLCRDCPEGTFCSDPGLAAPQDCPKGHFCLAGSSLPLPCPPVRVKYGFVFPAAIFRRLHVPWQGHPAALSVQGTYTDVERAGSCKPCPAGMFCSRAGLPEPEGHCQPGHYCSQGSSTSSPVSAQHLASLRTLRPYKSFHKP